MTKTDSKKPERVAILALELARGVRLYKRDVMRRFGLAQHAATESLKLAARVAQAEEVIVSGEKAWRLPRGSTALPVSSTPELAAALAYALDALRDLEGTPHHTELAQLAGHVHAQLDGPSQDRQERLARIFHPLATHEPFAGATARTTLLALWDALNASRVVSFAYESESGERSDDARRTVDPWAIVRHNGRLLLVSGKHIPGGGRERRQYHLEGISDLEVHDDKRTRPAREHLMHDKWWGRTFGVWHLAKQDPEDVVLVARGPAAVRFRQRRYHASQRNKLRDDGALEVSMSLVICREFEAFLLGMVPDIEVLGPPNLRDRLHDRCAAWLR